MPLYSWCLSYHHFCCFCTGVGPWALGWRWGWGDRAAVVPGVFAIKGKLLSLSSVVYNCTGINEMRTLKNSFELLQKMNSFYYPKIMSVQTFDLSALYISIPHQKLKDRMRMLVNQTFFHKNGSGFINEEASGGKKYDETLICQLIDFLTENNYNKIGNQ